MRAVLTQRDGVALAEWLHGDTIDDAGAFDVDLDTRTPRVAVTSKRLAVLHGDELVGVVTWIPVTHGPTAACEAWNIGIGLVSAARGRGVGTLAQRLLVEHLFATTDVDRVEASTDEENLAEIRALAKAGLRREGIVRGAQLRGGVRRNLVLFALTRADFEASPGDHELVVARDGVALVTFRDDDRDLVHAASDGAFDLDPDPRPRPFQPMEIGRLAVTDEASGELLGVVSWHSVDYGGSRACSAWNIGIELMPSARGRGVGSTVQRLLAEHLFATTDLDRVEAGTDAENIAEQRALTNAGFRLEGVLRGAQLRGGVRRDMAVFGILRADIEDAPAPDTVLVQRDGVALVHPDAREFRTVFQRTGSIRPGYPPPPALSLARGRASVKDPATGELLGGASWQAVHYGGSPGGTAWNIGLALVPDARGHGVGATAAALLAEHLFATTDLDRVEASTDVDNLAAQRALDKAGFHREGVLRGVQEQDGQRRDMVFYAVLRADLATRDSG